MSVFFFKNVRVAFTIFFNDGGISFICFKSKNLFFRNLVLMKFGFCHIQKMLNLSYLERGHIVDIFKKYIIISAFSISSP